MKERLDEDDFIEDDDGSGYVDNGMDDFDRPTDEEEESDSDEGECWAGLGCSRGGGVGHSLAVYLACQRRPCRLGCECTDNPR